MKKQYVLILILGVVFTYNLSALNKITSASVSDSTYEDSGKDSTYEGNEYSFPDSENSSYHSTAGALGEDTVEIFVIDNYILSDQHNLFVISFFTSERTKSYLKFDNGREVEISKELSDSHKDTIDITRFNFKTKTPHFVIVVEDSLGKKYTSERYDLEIPEDVEIRGESNFLLLCLFGGTVFVLPYPNYVYWGDKSYWGLTKEIPLVFLRSSDYQYPLGYFSIEYSYIWDAPVRNFLRVGYKHIIKVPGIEFISPGVSGFTSFHGFNGISPELTVGWFKIFNVFTVYSRFRYNVKPGKELHDFSDISIGLYSGFFAIYF